MGEFFVKGLRYSRTWNSNEIRKLTKSGVD